MAQRAGEVLIALSIIEAQLTRLYLGGGSPRNEEKKKAREVAGLLDEIARVQPQPVPRGKARVLVDAAAGNGYVALCAAALLGWRRVVAIERDADRAQRVRAAAAKLETPIDLRVAVASLDELSSMPREADVLVALHACGPATDAVLRAGIAARARWILCAPCCYGVAVPGWAEAIAEAERLGLPDDAITRSRFAIARTDGHRLATLENAGYEASLRVFTAPTVTPHNLFIRARRGGNRSAAK